VILHGDCLEEMRKMEDNSIDFIVTDSPYGILFMGKDWDQQIPSIEYWKEMLRVCKPGSMMACAGLPRMYHRLACVVEDAGWIIRDCILHIFGSGFPKSHNHFGFEGYGTALKPSYEPWILAMKPLDGTFAQNAEKWGIAGINIDAARIPTCDILSGSGSAPLKFSGQNNRPFHDKNISLGCNQNQKGRWPANLILDEEAGQILDQQSGILKTGDINPYISKNDGFLQGCKGKRNSKFKGDSGGASRYFYCAKASTRERNEGLDKPSSHPTIKPLSLMRYIIKLLAPPGNPILLDTFAGSGSTCIAALQLGIRAIGIEKNAEYCEIARKRLEYHGQADKQNRQREQRCWQETFDFEEDG
jgi:DNA modification methylase